jgi:hypothetical protein
MTKNWVLFFYTCSKKLKEDESELSPHLVASTSRLFERLISAFAMYYKTVTEYEFFLIMNFVIWHGIWLCKLCFCILYHICLCNNNKA